MEDEASPRTPADRSRPGGVPGPSPLALTPEEMETLGRRAVELLVERWAGLAGDAAWRGADRVELEPLLREPAPERGGDPARVLERAARDVLPLAARVDHPRFFAFVPGSPTWPGVLADFLAAGFNTFQGTWLGSAGPSQVELVVTDWIREWIGYPEGAGGLFTSGGSAANLDALVAAREDAGNPERPTVYMSDQAHSALVRAARIVGIPGEGVRVLPSRDDFRLDPEAVARAVAEDRAAGRTPVAVLANGGATNTGIVDPLPALADLCTDEGLWLHVDAAYGGFAVLDPAGRETLRGLERADSVALDAHKWLFQPFEAGCLLLRDARKLEAAFHVRPEYLQDVDLGTAQVNFADRGLQLTRSFRALKVWVTVQTFGMEAIREAVGRGIALARRAGAWIEEREGMELLSPPTLGVVCFRVRPPGRELDEAALEALNQAVQARVVESGVAMTSSTRLKGTFALRLCILNHTSAWDDVRAALEAMEAAARG